ncbi:hypothetical protein CBW46_017265 [Paenibacillus xerothermodurans]|uniref:MarR family transcriptional regulator n=2 Tax=Paenibacillus xerothermodurans TaxID=1977292 RepID=A0A2W1NY08_PAEXE|nr:hypothetical protein CBW46_017265 [Paenibacillus xerothermodurans]
MLDYFQTMIRSSTRNPKFMSISTAKVADIMGVQPSDIEQQLNEFVQEGKLVKDKLTVPPYEEIYLLPTSSSQTLI